LNLFPIGQFREIHIQKSVIYVDRYAKNSKHFLVTKTVALTEQQTWWVFYSISCCLNSNMLYITTSFTWPVTGVADCCRPVGIRGSWVKFKKVHNDACCMFLRQINTIKAIAFSKIWHEHDYHYELHNVMRSGLFETLVKQQNTIAKWSNQKYLEYYYQG